MILKLCYFCVFSSSLGSRARKKDRLGKSIPIVLLPISLVLSIVSLYNLHIFYPLVKICSIKLNTEWKAEKSMFRSIQLILFFFTVNRVVRYAFHYILHNWAPKTPFAVVRSTEMEEPKPILNTETWKKWFFPTKLNFASKRVFHATSYLRVYGLRHCQSGSCYIPAVCACPPNRNEHIHTHIPAMTFGILMWNYILWRKCISLCSLVNI